MKQLIACALIKSEHGDFIEDFEVKSKETAEKEIRDTINFFNDTLKPGEAEREFGGIERFEEKTLPDFSDSDFDIDEDADDPVWDENDFRDLDDFDTDDDY